MKNIHWILLVVGLVLGVAVSSIDGAAPKPPTPPRVAFFDLARVFDESEKKLAMQKQMNGFIQTKQDQLKAMDDELAALRNKMQMMKRDSPEFQSLASEMVSKEAQFKFEKATAEDDVKKQLADFQMAHVETIRLKVKEFAKAAGYDLILQRQLPSEDETGKLDIVFFAIDELDVTDQVLALVNRE